jgi:hypothetical protein
MIGFFNKLRKDGVANPADMDGANMIGAINAGYENAMLSARKSEQESDTKLGKFTANSFEMELLTDNATFATQFVKYVSALDKSSKQYKIAMSLKDQLSPDTAAVIDFKAIESDVKLQRTYSDVENIVVNNFKTFSKGVDCE